MPSSTRKTQHPRDSFRCPVTGEQITFDSERFDAETALERRLGWLDRQRAVAIDADAPTAA